MALFQLIREFASRLSGSPKNGEQTSREQMDEAIKRILVPELRAMGFAGSMPHLRRQRGETWDLLSLQFSKWGGSFAINVARCGPNGIDDYRGVVPAAKVTALDVIDRQRVGATRPGEDYWFKFENIPAEEAAQLAVNKLRDERFWASVERLPVGRTAH
jgi:hypothetical protein